jgi:hypothetical protein
LRIEIPYAVRFSYIHGTTHETMRTGDTVGDRAQTADPFLRRSYV